ncbi:MAG TPA: DUF983 domain-containing protein [Gemmatimonadales bacterium]
MADGPRSPSPLRLFSRALQLRCPRCAGHPVFASWLRMVERCPACGMRTARGEEGYVVGAYMFNIIAAELVWAGVVGALIWFTWPDPPWEYLLYGSGLLMIVLPFLCYPFSRTLFLAFDLLFRPAEDTEVGTKEGGGQ